MAPYTGPRRSGGGGGSYSSSSYDDTHREFMGEIGSITETITSERENEEMQRMTSFGRPFRNNAFRIVRPLAWAPQAEVKSFTSQIPWTAPILLTSDTLNVFDLLSGMTYSDNAVRLGSMSRSTNRIHLQSLNMKALFRFIPAAPTVSAVAGNPFNIQMRFIIVRTPCLLPYTDAASFAANLLNVTTSTAGASAYQASYNAFNNSFFQVVYDQIVTLCSSYCGVGEAQDFFPTIGACNRTLSINIDLNNMLTEFPPTAIASSSVPIKGGLYVFTAGNALMQSATSSSTASLNYNIGYRVRFIDR